MPDKYDYRSLADYTTAKKCYFGLGTATKNMFLYVSKRDFETLEIPDMHEKLSPISDCLDKCSTKISSYLRTLSV